MNNNTIAKSVAIKIFFFSLLIGAVGVSIFYSKMNVSLTDHLGRELQMMGDARAEQVRLFLEGKENRVVDFSSDGFIKNSLYDIKYNRDKKETMNRLSNHLIVNKLPVDEDFYKVFALGINGVVVASTDDASIGQDMAGDTVFLTGKNRPYVESLSYDNVSNVKSFVLSAPVIRENEFVGVIVIKMLPDAMMDIMAKKSSFGEELDAYIINKDGYLITPSRFLGKGNGGILTQVVDTENSGKCLRDVEELVNTGEFHKSDKEMPMSFVDYRGADVIGAHQVIPKINWCLLSEVDRSVVWDGWRSIFVMATALIFLGAGVASLLVFLIIRRKIS